MFRKKYESSEDELLIRNDRDVDRPTDDIVSLDGEWDMIFLKKFVGIKQWDLINSHNSGPRGELILVDYKIYGRLY